jgi:hypothetical protein
MRSMLKWVALCSASLLAACGGGTGVQTVGSAAPPSGSGGTGTPTPTHSFVSPTDVKTYEAIGAVQHYEYSTRSDDDSQAGQLYAGDANTVRDSGISITYNPRDAIFELTISRPLGLVSVAAFRFQDPVHRTAFGGAAEPQAGVPQLAANKEILYLEAGSSSGSTLNSGTYYTTAAQRSDYVVGAKGFTSTVSTFFYQKPGTKTNYVTYAGFVRNGVTATEQQDNSTSPFYLRQTYSFDRGAFVFGERTGNSAVPRTGTGTYTGDMIATMVHNAQLDTNVEYPTYFQWIEGSHSTTIDFAALSVLSSFTGTLKAPTIDAYTSGAFELPAGTSFSAYSTATIDLINKGGFTGSFGCAVFGGTCVRGSPLPVGALTIAGSSIDGAFFGPAGEEIGGGFRIVGGTPDQRIDILGAFTGKK